MYPCNITFISATIETETISLCDYANYHMIMFVLCITVSGMLLLLSVASILYYGPDATPEQIDSIERCTRWALVMLLLSFGVDGAFIVFYLVCFVLVFLTTTVICVHSFQRAVVESTHTMVSSLSRSICRSSTPVSDSTTIQVIILNTSCPICLEIDDGPWHTTPCGHVFHPLCIRQWRRGTCPLCRAVMQ
jgi:hypothetical protein